jgi:hypothetical protein
MKIILLTILLLSASTSTGFALELNEYNRVTNGDRHNAFTDLAYWNGHYYLCYREGATHSSMDGEIVVLRSSDFRNWSPCGRLKTLGDDRDPHFALTPDALYVYFGVWDLQHGDGNTPTDRGAIRSHVAWTGDGTRWSKVHAIHTPRWWVWRVRWHEDRFYGIAYTAFRPKPPEREIRLLISEDGLDWREHAIIATERGPSESDFWFNADGSLNVISRMTDESNEAFWYRSDPSLKEWTGTGVGAVIHSPAVARWEDRVFVAGRGKDGGVWVTRLWELKDGRADELLTLPSGGDTAYPGLIVAPDAPTLLISWYSQHETRTTPDLRRDAAAVYTGRIGLLPDDK